MTKRENTVVQEELQYYPILVGELDDIASEDLYYPILLEEIEVPMDEEDKVNSTYKQIRKSNESENAEIELNSVEDTFVSSLDMDEMQASKIIENEVVNDDEIEAEKIEDEVVNDDETAAEKIENDVVVDDETAAEKIEVEVVNDDKTDAEKTKDVEEIDKQYVNDDNEQVVNEIGYTNLYEALKNSGGSIPSKKNEQGQQVDDLETIKTIEKKLPSGEKILYAYAYVWGGLLNENKLKKKKNGFFDAKFRDMNPLMIIITEKKVICTPSYPPSKIEIAFDKKDVVSVNGVFVKSGMLSFKDNVQIQVLLNDNNLFIINELIISKFRYEEYIKRITELLKS